MCETDESADTLKPSRAQRVQQRATRNYIYSVLKSSRNFYCSSTTCEDGNPPIASLVEARFQQCLIANISIAGCSHDHYIEFTPRTPHTSDFSSSNKRIDANDYCPKGAGPKDGLSKRLYF